MAQRPPADSDAGDVDPHAMHPGRHREPRVSAVSRGAGGRLFDIRTVPLTLSRQDARFAIVEPARQNAVSWHPDATEMIVQTTNGYPAHLQLFADTLGAPPRPARA